MSTPQSQINHGDLGDIKVIWDGEPKTLLELSLISLGGCIRDKKRWPRKIQDPKVLEKWTAELVSQGVDASTLKYVISEQQYLASVYAGPIYPAAVPGVYQSDDLIPVHLSEALVQGVRLLEEGPKDWHPGSANQVLDLIHPSLYPLVFKTSLVLPEDDPSLTFDTCMEAISKGQPIMEPAESGAFYSRQFQWLPAPVDVHEDHVTFTSYINNLHPVKHREMYSTLGDILHHFIPMFEHVLTDMLHPPPDAIQAEPLRLYSHLEEPSYSDEEVWQEWYDSREPRLPSVPEQYTPPPLTTRVTLRGRSLQVIVKMANIHLTPDTSTYPGGSWHVEGMKNEHIVATGIYYYDQENVQPARLAFRRAVDDVFGYEQGDDKGVEALYGLLDGEPLLQMYGSVTTFQGRCVCFPNYYQHRLEPFQLTDVTRPGYRKVLVFWLVDPNTTILSTARVPPQQLGWLLEMMSQEDIPGRGLNMLPATAQEVVEKCLSQESSCPYSYERACEYRQELMKERKYYVDHYQNEEYFERPFSLCEH